MWKKHLRKVGCVFSVKKVWGMELHLIKGKESLPSGCFWMEKNKAMDIEGDKRFVESGPWEKGFVHGQDWLSLE